MTFETFLNNIINNFNTVFYHIINFIELVLDNNFIKFIIFLGLFIFVINLLCHVINIIYTILNNKHDKESLKNLFNSTDKETRENGGNIKSKDIYW